MRRARRTLPGACGASTGPTAPASSQAMSRASASRGTSPPQKPSTKEPTADLSARVSSPLPQFPPITSLLPAPAHSSASRVLLHPALLVDSRFNANTSTHRLRSASPILSGHSCPLPGVRIAAAEPCQGSRPGPQRPARRHPAFPPSPSSGCYSQVARLLVQRRQSGYRS